MSERTGMKLIMQNKESTIMMVLIDRHSFQITICLSLGEYHYNIEYEDGNKICGFCEDGNALSRLLVGHEIVGTL